MIETIQIVNDTAILKTENSFEIYDNDFFAGKSLAYFQNSRNYSKENITLILANSVNFTQHYPSWLREQSAATQDE